MTSTNPNAKMLGKSVVIVSGGMDSVTAVYWARFRAGDHSPLMLSFDYGQRHVKELECAVIIARDLGLEHHIINLMDVGNLIRTSALTDPKAEVPEGHYAQDTMKQTVVPNRNMMMLSIAAAVAVARGYQYVITGVHAGDHPVYPDCRPGFIQEMNYAIEAGNHGFLVADFQVEAPFIHSTKEDIARLGDQLGVPWDQTWSCYKGGKIHCGRCSTCVERLEAFHLAGSLDPTEYEDDEYWKEVVNAN